MDGFDYRDGRLVCEGVTAEALAERFGTPLYVYSLRALSAHYQRLQAAFAELDPLICFSVKSCQNVHILRQLRALGSGFDVVSGGELYRALRAGADPKTIVFAGVGKSDRELVEALQARVGFVNVESESELERLGALASEHKVKVDAALRINPDVDAKTHAYTTTGRKETKFGVDYERAAGVFARAAELPFVNLRGLHVHIGSPVPKVDRYAETVARVLEITDELRGAGHTLDVLDLGGGYAVPYAAEEMPSAAEYAEAVIPPLRGKGLRLILEPGRSIAANSGVLLMRALHIKQSGNKQFVVVDASMNDLIRPALYSAYHFVWPVNVPKHVPPHRGEEQPFDDLEVCDVVGPVCESSDFLAKNRALPRVARGDLLAAFSAGAYASTMASQYNSRPRAAEVLVDGEAATEIRRRETYADLVVCEGLDEPA